MLPRPEGRAFERHPNHKRADRESEHARHSNVACLTVTPKHSHKLLVVQLPHRSGYLRGLIRLGICVGPTPPRFQKVPGRARKELVRVHASKSSQSPMSDRSAATYSRRRFSV